MSDPALPAPVRDLIRDLMSMSSNPAAYFHDPIHGSMLAEQYRRQGQTWWRALEMAIVETLERFPEYVNQQLAQQAQQNPERFGGGHARGLASGG